MNGWELLPKYDRLIHYFLKQVPDYLRDDCYHDCLVMFPEIVREYDETKAKFSTFLAAKIRGITTRYRREYKKHINSEPVEELEIPVEGRPASMTRDLMKAIKKLSPLEREIVIMYYFDEMTLAEIGEIFTMNIKTVYARLEKALEKMRVFLEGA